MGAVDQTDTRIGCTINVSDRIKQQFPKRPAVYRFTSGSAHSIGWLLKGHAKQAGDELEWRPNFINIGAIVAAVLTSTNLLLDT